MIKCKKACHFSKKSYVITLVMSLLLLLGIAGVAHSSIIFPNHIASDKKSSTAIAAENTTFTNQNGTWHTFKVRDGDTMATYFHRLKISYDQLDAILSIKQVQPYLEKLKLKREIRILVDEHHNVQGIDYQASPTELIKVTRSGKQFVTNISKHATRTELKYGSGVITTSLVDAGTQAGLPEDIVMQLPDIFSNTFNFNYLQKGDHFNLLYQATYLNEKLVQTGKIVAATFSTHGKEYSAIRYEEEKNHPDYYDLTGHSVHPSFLRYPVHFKRISSRFTLKRWHPVLHRYRRHAGVDFAAYRGAPVYATGNGKITLHGYDGGYGNTIIIQHSNQFSTLYAHMSEFAKGLHTGSPVQKGQIIGYVGSTGLTTGPHVHYEVLISGQPRNPLEVPLPDAQPISKTHLKEFKEKAKQMMAILNIYQT